ncbi:MAG: 4Fe-4S dicluster domain-containing protein [Clostridiales bacterium]|nr:4Fe-4S dicluster domain-containing protein [Clostridiales bacterium]
MRNIDKIQNKCCGCHACEQVCKLNAISFKENDEGFLYPIIDKELCVDCGKCLDTCPVENPFYNKDDQVGFAAWVKDENILKNSSSGGIFFSIAKEVISRNGYVSGCINDKNNLPKHVVTNEISLIEKMRGSKYVESDLSGTYQEIEEKLLNDEIVLFTGTPCQVAGLKTYLGKEYQKLISVDIICHGVPSRLLYNEYLKFEEQQHGGKLLAFDFRSKSKHNWSLTYKIKLKKGKKIKTIERMASLSPFYASFLEGSIYRESCYTCPYATINRSGDITIGDFWGVEKVDPALFNINGVSAIILNNEKGKIIFNEIQNNLSYNLVEVDDIKKHNGNLNMPSIRPKKRDEIYKDLKVLGFKTVSKKHMKTKGYLKDLIKDKIPNKFRYKIKKLLKKI